MHRAGLTLSSRVAYMSALLVLAATSGLLMPPADAAPAELEPQVASGASVFGARVEPTSTQGPQQAVKALQLQLGAKLPLVSEYLDWDDEFPSPYHQWLHDTGHQIVLLVKLKREDGSRPLWSSLANAQPGSKLYEELSGWATSIRDLGGPVYFVFHKEPNEFPNRANGTPATYRDAWARVAEVFDDVGATNATLVFAMAGYVYGQNGVPDAWYPGNRYVDVIASSGVNSSCSQTSCSSWRSQQQIMAPMVAWAADHPRKELAVVEGATVEDPDRPNRKGEWIDDAHAYLTDELLSRMAFYSYWSSSESHDFRITTSQQSINAATRWVTDPLWTS